MSDTSDTHLFSTGYTRAFAKATIAAVTFWHVAGAGPALAGHLDSYSSAPVAVGAWLIQLAVIAVGARLLLRDAATVQTVWPLVMIVMAAGIAAATVCPPNGWLVADWSWGTVGWVAVLLLLHRPLRELIGVLLLEAGITFGVLVINDGVSRHVIAAFLTVLYASASIQLMVAVAARTMTFTARVAAETANSQNERAAHRAVAENLAAARADRYRAARQTIVPLLQGLMDGTLDPGNPAVQTRSAFEATALRRLAAEGDNQPNPLIHELEACVDLAHRRGLAVELAVSGSPPLLSTHTRRSLAEPVMALLATTREYARVAVATDARSVCVSVLSDSTEPAPVRSEIAGMSLTTGRDDDLLWMEIRCLVP